MKKIALLVYDASLTGGAEKVAFNLACEFLSKYQVYLISVFNEKKYTNREKYSFYVLSNELIKIPYHIISLSKQLEECLKDNNIDILLSITAGVNTIAYLGTKKIKTKFIYCEHSNLENKTYGKKHEFRQLLGAKKADMVITLTERDRHNFINKYHLDSEKVISIPNWYVPCESHKEYQIDSKKIITVGRLEYVKGYDMLVQVAKKVFEKNKDWQWDIYGEGTNYKKIAEDIKNNNLEKKVILKGNVSNLSELYNNYAFFVMTSYYEGFPLVLLEAQSFNLPIISFNCPTGPDEIITNNENGFIIDNYDIDNMVSRIDELINNSEKRKDFSKKSKMKLHNYAIDVILNKWYQVIDRILEDK